MEVEREQVLAFRLARHGLAVRGPLTLAEAAACPASDYSRGSALLALAARAETVTRDAYDHATDSGALVVGPTLRAAIHAVAPADFALYGRALVADDDPELADQLGTAAQHHLRDVGIAPRDALGEVTEATRSALSEERGLTRDELHDALRDRVRTELLPWCAGCGSHHVSPMLWRYGGVQAGMRFDAERHFRLGDPGAPPAPAEAVRRFLRFYGPATVKELGAWAGIARAHARRLWGQVEGELAEVRLHGRRTWLLSADAGQLESPPPARGVRLLPPRDPYVQQLDRATLVPDPELRKRVFRSAAGPGTVLQDGRLVGLWRVRARGKQAELDVEALEAIDGDELEAEAARVAALRGAEGATVRGI